MDQAIERLIVGADDGLPTGRVFDVERQAFAAWTHRFLDREISVQIGA
jgi:hypothetical protein